MRPGTGSELSVQNSVAPSTPDSTQVHLKQMQNTARVQEETLRSFVAEVKALEKECAHWREVVDQKHQALKATQKELEDEKLSHAETKRLASERDTAATGSVEAMMHELAGMIEVLGAETDSIQDLQAKARAQSRGDQIDCYMCEPFVAVCTYAGLTRVLCRIESIKAHGYCISPRINTKDPGPGSC
jgi:DNA repair exonuclease SbcCD ATPase subunit